MPVMVRDFVLDVPTAGVNSAPVGKTASEPSFTVSLSFVSIYIFLSAADASGDGGLKNPPPSAH